MALITAIRADSDIDNSINSHSFERRQTRSEMASVTVSALEFLSEADQKKVLNFTLDLLQVQEENPYKPLTEDEFYKELDESLAQADRSETRDAFESLRNIRQRLEDKVVVVFWDHDVLWFEIRR